MWTHERENDVHWDGEDETYWEFFTINDENGNEIARCDDEKVARFITAAPELLEALQKLLYVHGNTGDARTWSINESPEGVAAKAAIAKALGETK